MTKRKRESEPNATPEAGGPVVPPAEVARLRELLEAAQQRVRPLIKREREGENVTEDVLNFRLNEPL